jgi:hypothetical protein
VISPLALLLPGEDRQTALDELVAVGEDFDVAGGLLSCVWADLPDVGIEIAIRAAGITRDELEYDVVPASQFMEEPVFRFISQRGRTLA